jgi:hypothetical protein
MELLSRSVNALKMQSIILEHIKGEDLTKRLTEVLEFDPAGTYRITVQIEDEELASAASLPELAEILSKRAQSRGLTQGNRAMFPCRRRAGASGSYR